MRRTMPRATRKRLHPRALRSHP